MMVLDEGIGMGAANTPAVIDELRVFLEDSGFTLTSEKKGGMGGLEQVFLGEVDGQRTLVRVTSDRGHWAVEVKLIAMSRWIVPGVWLAYLDDQEVRSLSIDDQVGFAVARLGDVVRAAAGDTSIEEKLVRLGQDFMRKFLAGS